MMLCVADRPRLNLARLPAARGLVPARRTLVAALPLLNLP